MRRQRKRRDVVGGGPKLVDHGVHALGGALPNRQVDQGAGEPDDVVGIDLGKVKIFFYKIKIHFLVRFCIEKQKNKI
jgi:hypothetical protein